MKLLYINYEFPPLGGGGGRANAHIARQMVQMGHEVRILTSSFKGLPRHEERDGYQIHRIPTLRRHREKCSVLEMAVFMVLSIFYALYLASKWKPDRCIAFFTIPSGPAALALKKIFKIPYILSLRGGDVPGFSSGHLWIYHRILSPLIRYLWREAQSVVANSRGLRELALKTSADLDILMIPNGVDPHFFKGKPGLRDENGFQALLGQELKAQGQAFQNRNALRLLAVGRLSPQKGIEYLLTAFSRLRPQLQKPVQLWLVGDGPKRKALEQMAARLGIADLVFFLGWQDPDTVKLFYSSADLFVLPSLDEGMPNVVLEAMAMGLPIVATDVAGTRDLVRTDENGYLVPAKDPESLQAALHRLIHDDAVRARMAHASAQLARQYDWKEVASEYLELCQSA